MRISRSSVAIGVLVLLIAVVAVGRWYEKQSPATSQTVGSTLVNVTNGGDQILRCARGITKSGMFEIRAATKSALFSSRSFVSGSQ